MNITAKNAVGVGLWLLCLGAWIYLDCFAGDWYSDGEYGLKWIPWGNFAIAKNLLRVAVIVPFGTVLGVLCALWGINRVDEKTPEKWWEVLTSESAHWSTKIAIALVVSSLMFSVIIGVFWLATQG